VMLGVVELITALGDWVSMTLLMEDAGMLLQLLTQMLGLTGDVAVQLPAVECLLAITCRKVSGHSVTDTACISSSVDSYSVQSNKFVHCPCVIRDKENHVGLEDIDIGCGDDVFG